jgi:uncharacterized protein YqgV (UPF0045/DUF77 family)
MAMKLTVDISMYPLAENYLEPIRAFITQLNSYPGLQVNTYPTATVLVGEHDVVMDAIKDALCWSQSQFGTSVFVTKFITGYEAE